MSNNTNNVKNTSQATIKAETALTKTQGFQELSPEQQKTIQNIMKEVELTDNESVVQFGVGVQKNITQFANGVLQKIRTQDSGQVGMLLNDLVATIKSVNIDSVTGKSPGFFSRLFGGLFNEAKKLLGRYDKVSNQIEKLTANLEAVKQDLTHELAVLDDLFDRNLEYFYDLNHYIIAGEKILKTAQDVHLKGLEDKAKATNEMIDLQKAKDYKLLIQRFEKRLHDIKLTRTVTLQTIPQIRIVQGNNQELITKIQSSILNTIPLWKNQIVLAVSLYRQKQAAQFQKKISDTTNEILSKNAEMIKENSVAIAKESQRGIVDIETLKQVNRNLIETISESLQIQEEGRLKRQAVEKDLVTIESDIRQALQAAKSFDSKAQ